VDRSGSLVLGEDPLSGLQIATICKYLCTVCTQDFFVHIGTEGGETERETKR
jgi:hypothetical protein